MTGKQTPETSDPPDGFVPVERTSCTDHGRW